MCRDIPWEWSERCGNFKETSVPISADNVTSHPFSRENATKTSDMQVCEMVETSERTTCVPRDDGDRSEEIDITTADEK